MGTFDQKTNEDDPNFEIIERIATVLTGPNLTLLEGFEEYIDLDQFFTFWAMETLVAHWDGYAGNTNNFYIYQDPDDARLRFMPWGVDGTFNEPRRLFEDALAPRSINANGLLARRLYLHPDLERLQGPALDERYHFSERRLQTSSWTSTGMSMRFRPRKCMT